MGQISQNNVSPFTQSNLCTTTFHGTIDLWLLLTGGRCSKVGLRYKDSNWDSKIVVAVGKRSLLGSGRIAQILFNPQLKFQKTLQN